MPTRFAAKRRQRVLHDYLTRLKVIEFLHLDELFVIIQMHRIKVSEGL